MRDERGAAGSPAAAAAPPPRRPARPPGRGCPAAPRRRRGRPGAVSAGRAGAVGRRGQKEPLTVAAAGAWPPHRLKARPPRLKVPGGGGEGTVVRGAGSFCRPAVLCRSGSPGLSLWAGGASSPPAPRRRLAFLRQRADPAGPVWRDPSGCLLGLIDEPKMASHTARANTWVNRAVHGEGTPRILIRLLGLKEKV